MSISLVIKQCQHNLGVVYTKDSDVNGGRIAMAVSITSQVLEAVAHWCSLKKAVLSNFVKFKEKHLCGNLFFHKVFS